MTLLIASRCVEEHIEYLQLVFECRQHFGFKMNVKCIFGTTKMSFLEREIDETRISPLPEKIAAIQKFPQRDNFVDLLDLPTIIDDFLPHCSTLLAPLTYLLRRTKKKQQKKNRY